jgi:DNA-binding response OmpR family regulator
MAKFVLIVDDDAEMRRAVAASLKDVCPTREAVGGAQALEMIADGPSLAILDLSMPGTDGLDVLRALKDAGTVLPVLVLTGERDMETAKRALDLGASAYLTKPFDVAFLRAEVRRLLNLERRAEDGGRPWRVAA